MHIAECAGGVDIYLKMLLSQMDKKKYTQILICSQNYQVKKYLSLVDHLEQIPMAKSIGIKDIFIIKKIRTLIKYYRPDIIYCHSSKAGGYGRLAKRGLNCKVIYNPHGWAFNMQCGWFKHKIFLYTERLLGKFTDQFICISEKEKYSAKLAHVGNQKKMNVIRNGIDVDKLKNRLKDKEIITREKLGIPLNAFLFGMVGRIVIQKAPDIFIRAAAIVKKKIPTAYFIIVGDGDLTESIKKYAKKAGIQNSLIITGWVDDAIPYIKLMDVACLLSRWEGFGLVLTEYMALNKPIIATNTDAIPELIKDGVNGNIVEVDNIDAVAKAMINFYDNPKLCQKYVLAGSEIVTKNFDIKRVAYETEMLINSVVQSSIAK